MSVPAFEAGALFTTLDIIMIDIGAPETSREKVCNAKNVDLMIPNTKLFVRSLRASAPKSALVSSAADPANDAADGDQRRRAERRGSARCCDRVVSLRLRGPT
jgi:hypothetical protein